MALMTLSLLETTLCMMSTVFGAGILTIPFAFAMAGTINSFIIMAIVGIVTIMTLCFLVEGCESLEESSYAGICRNLGQCYKKLLNYIVMLACYLTSIVFAQMIHECVCKLSFYMPYKETTVAVILCFVLYLLLMLKSPKKLAIISKFSIFAVISIAFQLLLQTLFHPIKTSLLYPQSVSKGIGFFIFAMGCHPNCCYIYSSMTKKTPKNAFIAFTIAITFACLIYCVIGYCASIIIGSGVSHNFLADLTNLAFSNHLEGSSNFLRISTLLSTISFVVILFSAFLYQTFAARNSLLEIVNISKTATFPLLTINLLHVICTFVYIVYKFDAIQFMSLLGTICGGFISYIFPSFIFMSIKRDSNCRFLALPIIIGSITLILYMIFTQIYQQYFIGSENIIN